MIYCRKKHYTPLSYRKYSLNFSLLHRSAVSLYFFDSHIQSAVLLITEADETFRSTEHEGVKVAILKDFFSFFPFTDMLLEQACCILTPCLGNGPQLLTNTRNPVQKPLD